ncbi:unnamed protein product [Spirodela intermedia]|uniref:Pectinesterase n=1 Tax=Spirodela intermedia TaxID=51605 RepID=A0A7I8J5A4_SPIIN|nr:unnamed protein product [Spirodela intermedia]CAA6664572.1 unnamed protein product [Spirodela intermedia]
MASRLAPLFLLLFVCCTHVGRVERPSRRFLPVPGSHIHHSLHSRRNRQCSLRPLHLLGAASRGDLRVSSAVQDCLGWTLSTASPSTAGVREKLSAGTGNKHFDLRSWLSAALGNQETCAESFQGTDDVVKSLVVGSLDTITSLVYQVLTQVPDAKGLAGDRWMKTGKRKLLDSAGFPIWMTAEDRRFLQGAATSFQPDVVVSADGSGDYKTVGEAVEKAPLESEKRFVIYVKKGVYKENVDIKKKKWNVVVVGDGMGATVISGARNYVDGWTTYRSATFAVSGKGFLARGLTVENTAGPAKHQAVAFRSDSDLSALFQVEFLGYQDTLYAHSLRQFYRECRISGTIDFIFGNAAAVFQSCTIVARRPLPKQKNSVTAQGRKYVDQNTGFSIHGCNISVEGDNSSGAVAVAPAITYLGRPWKKYSRTVVMQSYLGSGIRRRGGSSGRGTSPSTRLLRGVHELRPGLGLSGRVKWAGFHAITDPRWRSTSPLPSSSTGTSGCRRRGSGIRRG